jgi:divalent metal cation (Fe/Co/Zn/Cd) transporter
MSHVQALPEMSSLSASLRASRIVLAANLALMTIQLATGWLTGSNAIVADGVHTLVDLFVDAILLMSLKPRSTRASTMPPWLPSAFVALLLTLTGAELLWQGLNETAGGADVTTSVQLCALAVAMTVIVTRACIARYLGAVSSDIETTHADAAGLFAAGAWHARIDAISAGAAAVGALGTLAGFAHLDQLATLTIGGMMCCMGLLHEGSVIRLGVRQAR